MTLWESVGALDVVIESSELEGLSAQVSSAFERKSTVIHLSGGGEEGIGEDVTYDAVDHDAFQRGGPIDLAGAWTIASLSEHIARHDLFAAKAPERDVSRRYRRWAYESAALDLALRQNDTSLHALLGRTPRPLTFVVSLRLGEPPSLEPMLKRMSGHPNLRFKLDPTSSWTDELIAELLATGAVAAVDFKGHYRGTVVDQPPDARLYARVAEAFHDAWLEDPALTPETIDALRPHVERFSWDAPIHTVSDIESLPYPPRMVNIKPSRMGSLEELLAAYEHCERRGIGAYGGGQFELGVGRDHIQYLASVFHPDTPNDVAPVGYNAVEPSDGLPDSPLTAEPPAVGMRGISPT